MFGDSVLQVLVEGTPEGIKTMEPKVPFRDSMLIFSWRRYVKVWETQLNP